MGGLGSDTPMLICLKGQEGIPNPLTTRENRRKKSNPAKMPISKHISMDLYTEIEN